MMRQDPNILLRQASSLLKNGDMERSSGIYKFLLAHFPPKAEVLNNLADIEVSRENYGTALDLFRRSLKVRSNQPAVCAMLGRILYQTRQLVDSLAAYNRAISLRPDLAAAHNGRGIVLMELGRFDEAIASFEKAIALDPINLNAYNNKAMLLGDLHHFDEALSCIEQALAVDPKHAESHNRKAELALAVGRYEEGWRIYEWRWKTQHRRRHRLYMEGVRSDLALPDLAGKTVAILPEAGLGDYIMFVRYARLLKELGARVIICSPRPLVSLLAEMDEAFTVVPQGSELAPHDVQLPIMTLPRIFGTTLDSVPDAIPYLKACAIKHEQWASRLGEATRPRVGLMWAGRRGRQIDRSPLKGRSLPLDVLKPIVELPFEFHALQKEVPDDETALLQELGDIIQHQDEIEDFSDTAALIENMHLVISIDTSVAHVAGALGKPVYVMLPFSADYRWMQESETTPWYPQAKLFRQLRPGDWQSVVNAVSNELTVKKPF